MPRKPVQLPPGVRFLTPEELDARRAAKAADKVARKAERAVAAAAGDGWALRLPRIRRRRRRRRVPAGIFRQPGRGF